MVPISILFHHSSSSLIFANLFPMTSFPLFSSSKNKTAALRRPVAAEALLLLLLLNSGWQGTAQQESQCKVQ